MKWKPHAAKNSEDIISSGPVFSYGLLDVPRFSAHPCVPMVLWGESLDPWAPDPCAYDLGRTGRRHPSPRSRSCSDTLQLPQICRRSMCCAGWVDRIGQIGCGRCPESEHVAPACKWGLQSWEGEGPTGPAVSGEQQPWYLWLWWSFSSGPALEHK